MTIPKPSFITRILQGWNSFKRAEHDFPIHIAGSEELDIYNAEVHQGIIHTEEKRKKMIALQHHVFRMKLCFLPAGDWIQHPETNEFVKVAKLRGEVLAGYQYQHGNNMSNETDCHHTTSASKVVPTATVSLPCNKTCSKCGSADIVRRYRSQGEQWKDHKVDFLARERTRFQTLKDTRRRARIEHIEHHCRCCQWGWQTPPSSSALGG